jgi:hypothetical protein
MKHIKTGDCFAILITSDKYKKLLAVQVFPQTKYFFKDKEVTPKQFVEILEQTSPGESWGVNRK